MTTAATYLLVVLLVAGLGLFAGGVISAAIENHRERRTLGYVTRPGWKRQEKRHRRAGVTDQGRGRDYLNRLVTWPLLALGLAGFAERYMARRARGRVTS